MANPLFLNSASVTIDGVEQADLVSNVTLTPTSSALTFKGVSGETSQSQGTEVWACSLTYAQDFTTADSLALTLFNNAGDNVVMVFTPKTGGPTITANVTLVAGSFGGAVDAVAEATVVLPVSGRPTISPVV